MIYPNPSKHQFFLELPNELQLNEAVLTTIMGQRIFNFNKTGWIRLPKTINKGFYILKIETNKGSLIKKIIVE